MDAESYLALISQRLERAGFGVERRGSDDLALVGHRRQGKLSRFGFVDTVVGVGSPRPSATSSDLEVIADRSFNEALRLKVRLPRGLGSQVVSYPALVVDQCSDELRSFAATYAPKHWSAMDFPIVVDLATGTLVFLEKTPMWGAAYYKRTREEARELLSPAAVSET